MRFVSYKWWARYIYFITKKYVNKHSTVLELAAGNCLLAKYLRKQFSSYVAADISFNMLNNSEVKIDRVCCDMIQLPFKGKYDLILAAFDSVNYLTNKRKLKSLFDEVNSLLKDEGIFTFDAALESNSYKHQKTASDKGNINGFSYTRKSIFLPNSRIHKNIFWIKKPNGEVVTETHRQKIFAYQTYFELAEKSNLYVVNCYKAFSVQRGSNKSDRVQFIMKRKS